MYFSATNRPNYHPNYNTITITITATTTETAMTTTTAMRTTIFYFVYIQRLEQRDIDVEQRDVDAMTTAIHDHEDHRHHCNEDTTGTTIDDDSDMNMTAILTSTITGST